MTKKLKPKDFLNMGAAYALTPEAIAILKATDTLKCLAVDSIICGNGYLVPVYNKPDLLVPLKGLVNKKMAKKIANCILKARKSVT